MNSSTALLIIAIVSFASMVYVIDKANDTNKSILDGIVKVREDYYSCRKIK